MSKQFIGYIYLIKNLYNNKVYVGQTKNIKLRINSHFRIIQNKSSLHLYRAIKNTANIILFGE